MSECNGLKITARYSNKDGPCPGGHQCDNAVWNLYLGENFIGIIDLNNLNDGGDRTSELYANGDDISDYISEFGCELKFEAKCVNSYCHTNITWFTVENDDGDILLDSCVLDSFKIDCCGGGPPPPPVSTTTRRPTTTTTRRPTTTTSTTTATTRRPTTTTTRTTGTTTTKKPDRCDPSTQPPPIINDPIDAELTTVPSTTSPWDIILINPNFPLSFDTILTTTTSTTTSTTTTPKPILIPPTSIRPCDVDCNKLGY